MAHKTQILSDKIFSYTLFRTAEFIIPKLYFHTTFLEFVQINFTWKHNLENFGGFADSIPKNV